MKSLVASLALTVCLGLGGVVHAQTAATPPVISGAGGSIQSPLFKAWIANYQTASGRTLTYQGQNSAFGISQIDAKAADFGVTATPLSDEQLRAKGLVQFPFLVSGTVLVTNVPGLDGGKLRLDSGLVAAIFLGEITKWDDARIKAVNPDLDLPDWPITVAHRTDPASMTLLLTSYLSAVSPAWKAGPGVGETVNWPIGLGGKGNAGISEIMGGTMGTIGYVEYAYAREHKLDLVALKNHDGVFLTPAPEAFAAVAAGEDWSAAAGFGVPTLDRPGAGSWPLVLVSYALVRDDAPADRRKRVTDFFDWGFEHGDAEIATLGYAPAPEAVKALARKRW
jgi:phosphate transport system substrate-binding protein